MIEIEREKNIKDVVKNRVSNPLFLHSIRVADTACWLVWKHNIDLGKKRVRKAALLHDLVKESSTSRMKKWALNSHWKPDEMELILPPVLHAPAAEYLCRSELAVSDKGILEAIRFHTIGKPRMGILAKIIFVADMIEPERDFLGVKEIRRTVNDDLNQGLLTACESSINYNFKKNRVIHPNTLKLRNQILRGDC